MIDIVDKTATVLESQKQGLIGQYRWLRLCQRSRTAAAKLPKGTTGWREHISAPAG